VLIVAKALAPVAFAHAHPSTQAQIAKILSLTNVQTLTAEIMVCAVADIAFVRVDIHLQRMASVTWPHQWIIAKM
jgi:NADH:ubiquinone oxidoreductase subunit K